MIHVSRSDVSRPVILESRSAAEERAEAKLFFADPKLGAQRRFEFRIYRDRTIKESLVKLFRHKSAYCESRNSAHGPGDIELFRPKGGLTERPDHPGYWWLASSWENMLIVCQDCN